MIRRGIKIIKKVLLILFALSLLILLFCVSIATVSEIRSQKKKKRIIKEIMSCKSVESIESIQGYSDWDDSSFDIRLIFNDGTTAILSGVDYRIWDSGKLRWKKSGELHFTTIQRLGNYVLVRFDFDFSKENPYGIDYTYDFTAIDEIYKNSVIYELYSTGTVQFFLDNYKKIMDAYTVFPELPNSFFDEMSKYMSSGSADLTWLRNYGIPEFQESRGRVYARCWAEHWDYLKWNRDCWDWNHIRVYRQGDGYEILE